MLCVKANTAQNVQNKLFQIPKFQTVVEEIVTSFCLGACYDIVVTGSGDNDYDLAQLIITSS